MHSVNGEYATTLSSRMPAVGYTKRSTRSYTVGLLKSCSSSMRLRDCRSTCRGKWQENSLSCGPIHGAASTYTAGPTK